MISAETGSRSELREQGYAVLDGVLDARESAALRARVLRVVDEIGPPALYAPETRELAPGAFLTSTGLALRGLLHREPDLAPHYLPPRVLACLREVLGDGMRLEEAGAMISDASRPFFTWHTHIDGEDEGVRLKSGAWPAVSKIGRVLTLLYLDDIDDDTGPVYVLPRKLTDPTAPPADPNLLEWPGHVELRPTAGTVIALGQCTWHAARSLARPGERVLCGAYFAARDVAPAPWADPRLAALLSG